MRQLRPKGGVNFSDTTYDVSGTLPAASLNNTAMTLILNGPGRIQMPTFHPTLKHFPEHSPLTPETAPKADDVTVPNWKISSL